MHNLGEFSEDISKQLMQYDEVNGTTCNKARGAAAIAVTTGVSSFAGYCVRKVLGGDSRDVIIPLVASGVAGYCLNKVLGVKSNFITVVTALAAGHCATQLFSQEANGVAVAASGVAGAAYGAYLCNSDVSLKPQTEEEAARHLRHCKDQYKSDLKYKADLNTAIQGIHNTLASRQDALRAEQRNESFVAELRYQNDKLDYDRKFQAMSDRLEEFVVSLRPMDWPHAVAEAAFCVVAGSAPQRQKTSELVAVDVFRANGTNDILAQNRLKSALGSVLKEGHHKAQLTNILSQCPTSAPNKTVNVGHIGQECSRLEESLDVNQSRLRATEARIKNVEHRYGVKRDNENSFQFPDLATFHRLMPK